MSGSEPRHWEPRHECRYGMKVPGCHRKSSSGYLSVSTVDPASKGSAAVWDWQQCERWEGSWGAMSCWKIGLTILAWSRPLRCHWLHYHGRLQKRLQLEMATSCLPVSRR